MRTEDPITGHIPSRIALEEEEEEAQARKHHYSDPPLVTWAPPVQAALKDGRLKLRLLVVATSIETCALLRHSCELGPVAGSVLCQEVSLEHSTLLPSITDQATYLHVLDEAALESGQAVMLGLSQGRVLPERSVAWCKGLLSQLQPQHVLVLAGLPAVEFRGPPSKEEDPQYVLETSAAPGSLKAGLPKLPTGTLVQGLPAAIMSHCQFTGTPATMLISVQPSQFPDAQSLKSAAAALRPLFASAGVEANLEDKHALSAASADLKVAFRRSARSSVYL